MKKITFLGAAALGLMAATSAHAQSGYVGAVYGNTDVDVLGDADFYGAELAIGGANFEFDASLLDSDSSDASGSGAGHFFSRNDSHLFGGFVGLADSGDSTTWTVGVEANSYMEGITLAGALVYGSNDDVNTDGFGFNGEARMFASENFRIDVSAGWATIDAGIAGNDDILSYGVGGEYLFGAISVGANFSHSEFDTANIGADTLSLALRYNWNGGTLMDRDRTGASQASLVGIGF